MKRMTIGITLCALLAAPGWAATTVEFGPGDGHWSYDGTATLSFVQTYPVKDSIGPDALFGMYVRMPDLTVGGIPGGPYTLTPLNSTIAITDTANTVTYLTGTLGNGNLVPIDTTGVGYTHFQADITGITVNNSIGSTVLAEIAGMSVPHLDFEFSLNGAGINLKNMLDNGLTGYDGFSGAMTVIPATPVPGAILLGALGTALVGWLRRRKIV